MKMTLMGVFFIVGLSGCGSQALTDLAGVMGVYEVDSDLIWTADEAAPLVVRGREYPMTQYTGRDRTTGEAFVVEYRTRVNGRIVTCVGDPNDCVGGIINVLDESAEEYA